MNVKYDDNTFVHSYLVPVQTITKIHFKTANLRSLQNCIRTTLLSQAREKKTEKKRISRCSLTKIVYGIIFAVAKKNYS